MSFATVFGRKASNVANRNISNTVKSLFNYTPACYGRTLKEILALKFYRGAFSAWRKRNSEKIQNLLFFLFSYGRFVLVELKTKHTHMNFSLGDCYESWKCNKNIILFSPKFLFLELEIFSFSTKKIRFPRNCKNAIKVEDRIIFFFYAASVL